MKREDIFISIIFHNLLLKLFHRRVFEREMKNCWLSTVLSACKNPISLFLKCIEIFGKTIDIYAISIGIYKKKSSKKVESYFERVLKFSILKAERQDTLKKMQIFTPERFQRAVELSKLCCFYISKPIVKDHFKFILLRNPLRLIKNYSES